MEDIEQADKIEKLNLLQNDKSLGEEFAPETVGAVEGIGKIASYKAMIKALQQDVKELDNKLFKTTVEKQELMEQLEEMEPISKNEVTFLSEENTGKEIENKDTDLLSIVRQLNEEVIYYKELASVGKISELTAKIDELTARIEAQNDIIEKRNDEIQTKNATIETAVAQNEMLKKNIVNLTQNMDGIMVQNEKLSTLNNMITKKLEETQKAIVNEITEKSDIYIEKLILSRRLEAAQCKLNLYNEKNLHSKSESEILKTENNQTK